MSPIHRVVTAFVLLCLAVPVMANLDRSALAQRGQASVLFLKYRTVDAKASKDKGKVIKAPLEHSESCPAHLTKELPKGQKFWGMDAPIVTEDPEKDGAGHRTFRGYSWSMILLRCVQER